jgi:hypothetical protein
MQLYSENINLQEALVREAKTAPNKSKQSGPKVPTLVQATSKKESNSAVLDKDAVIKSEAYELINNKCKSLED